MSLTGRRVAASLLAAVLVVVAALVLWPSHPDIAGVDRAARELLTPLVADGAPVIVLHAGAIEFAANIVMFLPLGFLGTLALPRRLWWIAPLACFALSCGIETTQLLLLPGRTFAVRDIVSNTTGGLVGSGAAVLLDALLQLARRGRER